MILTSKTMLANLLERYEFLLDFLPEYNPKFEQLKNPELRKVMAATATLELAAMMGGVPAQKLASDLKAKIEAETGETVEIDLDAAPPSDEEKLDTLKEIIRELHEGGDFNSAKMKFRELVRDITPTEISDMEQQLMKDGLPQGEVKRLCDVHVEIFRESLERHEALDAPPGHPVHTFMAENRAITKAAENLKTAIDSIGDRADDQALSGIVEKLDALTEVEKHYLRKENQLFPFLEGYGITGPTQVMWGIHDDIRALFKNTKACLADKDIPLTKEEAHNLVHAVQDMVYKEDNILYPMAMKTLSEKDWVEIRAGEESIGYAFVTPGDKWKLGGGPEGAHKEEKPPEAGLLQFKTGKITIEQLQMVYDNLPMEITFVDENDEVRFFTHGRRSLFTRSPAIIGRKVQNCHPPKSLHMVEKILDAFKSGEKDEAEFWINFRGRFVHIRYFAIRDEAGEYRGVMEVTQDATDIRKLRGEKRLLDWED